VRFAVVGCGRAARRLHLPAIRAAGAEATAFASRTRTSAERARDEWGSGVVVDAWEDAVARDDVDAVAIATPNRLHRDVAIAAMQAGKHVLVDKPMATTVKECDDMLDASVANDVVLVPFQNTRFAPAFVAAHDAVVDGRIGHVTGVRAAFGHGGPHGWAPDAVWFFDRAESGGGCLIDLGVHLVDLVRYVTGHEIVEVAAELHSHAGEVETDAQLLVRFDNRAIGTLHASWSARPGPDHQLTVIGTDGTLHLDNRTALTLLPKDRLPLPEDVGSPYDVLLDSVRDGVPPVLSGQDGRAAVAVIEAAYRAADERRTATVA